MGLGGRGKRGSGGKELISLSEDVKRLNGSSVTDFLAFRQTIRLLDNIRKFAWSIIDENLVKFRTESNNDFQYLNYLYQH